ncbi:hypothetical protein [Ferrimonas balearica]|uniref:hypothetical protein n=1 Tax=Ferrimonas balearica TaxID=44012 RepID=UPI001C5940AC|nr:hypothetical protein [Ferrimonas balearica]MBW3165925.1 hypothetical protein [Ferrimonas balearica]
MDAFRDFRAWLFLSLSLLAAPLCASPVVLQPQPVGSSSNEGFEIILLITPDPDWEAKWNTPPTVAPQFNTADQLEIGEQVTILPFYINPMPDAQGEVRITCQFTITAPDGQQLLDKDAKLCADGGLVGSPTSVRLAPHYFKFIGESTDAPGLWQFGVTMTDEVRGVSVSTGASITLIHTPQ